MQKLFTLILLLTATQSFASSKEGGTVYICSNSDNSIKVTADLSMSDAKHDQVVVLTMDGISKVFHEFHHKKRENVILFGTVKNSTFQVKKDEKSPPIISLDINPDSANAQVAHSGEGVMVTKFEATLTAPSVQALNEVVSCLETKWSDQ